MNYYPHDRHSYEDGSYYPEDQWKEQHVYYKPLLQDIMASYKPNPTMNQFDVGQKYTYLTKYKKDILRDHKQFNNRGRVQRGWWS
jgi:hypothetical protein